MKKEERRVINAAMKWNKAYLRYVEVMLLKVPNGDDQVKRVMEFKNAQLNLSSLCCAALSRRKKRKEPR